MPWDYAAEAGIVEKWADKYGITIEVVQFNDYIESINQYTAGAFDGCTMTNMDALTIPAAGGRDSTALIVGDFSNGNDGIVLKGAGKTLADIKGQNVNLVELSVSHYMLARALATAEMAERDLTVVNTSDADIVAAFATGEETKASRETVAASSARRTKRMDMVASSMVVTWEAPLSLERYCKQCACQTAIKRGLAVGERRFEATATHDGAAERTNVVQTPALLQESGLRPNATAPETVSE